MDLPFACSARSRASYFFVLQNLSDTQDAHQEDLGAVPGREPAVTAAVGAVFSAPFPAGPRAKLFFTHKKLFGIIHLTFLHELHPNGSFRHASIFLKQHADTVGGQDAVILL